jgi:small subunit ribosomal protein S1
MESLLEEHDDYSPPRSGDVRLGTIMQMGPEGALIDIGFKREGFVSREDLDEMHRAEAEELEVGNQVPVLVLRAGGDEGYIPVSIHKARLAEDWIKAEQLLKSGEVHEAEISGYNRGGLTVRFGRIRGFVPLSHVVGIPRRMREADRRERLKEMVGQQTGLQVIEVDRRRRRLIFSQRQAHRAWQRVQKGRLLEELEAGEKRTGYVTSITDFGAFVDLGGADGLIHISELSWGRIDNPREVVRIGQQVEVKVLDVDRGRKRIALSLKQTQENPWDAVEQRYGEDQLVEGKVTQVTNIGAFVELEPGIEGLLHVSELVGAPAVVPQDVLQPGDEVLVKIVRLEKDRRRVGLSARKVRREEWERWATDKAAAAAAAEAQAPETEEPAVEVEAAAEGEEHTPAAEEQVAEELAAEVEAEAAAAAVDEEEAPEAEEPAVEVEAVAEGEEQAPAAEEQVAEEPAAEELAAEAEAATVEEAQAEAEEPAADDEATAADEAPASEDEAISTDSESDSAAEQADQAAEGEPEMSSDEDSDASEAEE